MKVTVHITAEDIACDCHQAYNCPGHLAITRLLKPEYHALVCASYVALQRRELPDPHELRSMSDEARDAVVEQHTIKSPDALQRFILVYDTPEWADGAVAEPVSFELDIPEQYLREAA